MENPHLQQEILIHGGCSIIMVVFGGVTCSSLFLGDFHLWKIWICTISILLLCISRAELQHFLKSPSCIRFLEKAGSASGMTVWLAKSGQTKRTQGSWLTETENGFMELKYYRSFRGDEGHPKVIVWEYDDGFLERLIISLLQGEIRFRHCSRLKNPTYSNRTSVHTHPEHFFGTFQTKKPRI